VEENQVATTSIEDSFENFANTPITKLKRNEPTSEEREIQELEELKLKAEEL